MSRNVSFKIIFCGEMKACLRAALIIVALFLCPSLFAADNCSRKGLPFDDGLKDPSFSAWRQDFLQAVQRKDVSFLLEALDPSIETKRDCEKKNTLGIESFKITWQDSKEDRSFKPIPELWNLLEEILTHGAISTKENPSMISFKAPYYHAYLDTHCSPSDCPCYYLILIDKNVELRKHPQKNAAVLARLSYEKVSEIHDSTPLPQDWTHIQAFNQAGYVETKHLRYSSNYWASFHKKNGQWKMSELNYFPIACGG